jgi:anti-sigma factor RsiW
MSDVDANDLRLTAAEYVAGDLAAEEAAEFEELLANQAELQREVAYWSAVRPGLARHGRPPARVPGPGMADVIRRRLAERGQAVYAPAPTPAARDRIVRFPTMQRWLPGMAAGIAAALLVVLGLDALRGHPSSVGAVAFTDDGREVGVVDHGRSLALHRVSQVDRQQSADYGAAERSPWLGWEAHVVSLQGFEAAIGIQVVQVVEAGPAWQAGIRPGDVVLRLGCQDIRSPGCVSNFLANLKPGAELPCEIYRPGTRTVGQSVLRVGAQLR